MESKEYSPLELAQEKGVSRLTVYRWKSKGVRGVKLGFKMVGGQVRITSEHWAHFSTKCKYGAAS